MKNGSKLSPKHQISIAKAAPEQFSWKPGQELVFVPNGNGVLATPAPEMESSFGIAPGLNTRDYRDRHERY